MATESQIKEFARWARRAGAEKLSLCSSGNLSWRLDDGTALVSATGAWLSDLEPADVAVCRLGDGASLNGVRPSREARFHLGVYRERPEVNAVLHFQSTCATALACSGQTAIDINLTAEVPLYVGREVPVVPYFMPGSAELADAVTQALLRHDSCFLANHGQVVAGTSLADAFQKAVFFEMGCRLQLLAHGGVKLSPEALRQLTGQ